MPLSGAGFNRQVKISSPRLCFEGGGVKLGTGSRRTAGISPRSAFPTQSRTFGRSSGRKHFLRTADLGPKDARQEARGQGWCAHALAPVEKDIGDRPLADLAAFVEEEDLVQRGG